MNGFTFMTDKIHFFRARARCSKKGTLGKARKEHLASCDATRHCSWLESAPQ
jgi:hypothetical protein